MYIFSLQFSMLSKIFNFQSYVKATLLHLKIFLHHVRLSRWRWRLRNLQRDFEKISTQYRADLRARKTSPLQGKPPIIKIYAYFQRHIFFITLTTSDQGIFRIYTLFQLSINQLLILIILRLFLKNDFIFSEKRTFDQMIVFNPSFHNCLIQQFKKLV